MKSMDDLNVSVPSKKSLVVRNIKNVSKKQREEALKKTEYNMFSFPADLLVLDFLSDSGSGAMTDLQWSGLFHGDESYGRNKGYYVLLEAIRDIFERGDNYQRKIDLILYGERDPQKLMEEIYLKSFEGGFANGGIFQLEYPNAFIVPQGRCAEFLLFSTISSILRIYSSEENFFIPNNGHFDTTEANIAASGMVPINFFSENLLSDFPISKLGKENDFKGNMDVDRLDEFISEKGSDKIPLIYLTITNNTAAGQPVSLKNIKEVSDMAEKYGIPLFFDACRFAENAYFIKKYENGYGSYSINEIVKKMFSYADGFTISFKKDGLANIGGGLFFRDRGVFHSKFSNGQDIGIRLKEKQILTFGNDSYGGLSGRDIMALAIGLYEVVNESYLENRLNILNEFGRKLAKNNVPVILPPGGHAIYLNMDKFFSGLNMKPDDFGGVGFTIELLRHYGIRACELGPFAFEWDKKSSEMRKGILNLVRFALPRNMYDSSHINYAVAAVTELFKNRESIPKVKINRGAELRLRHFQSGLIPKYD
ncbi:MAG: tryptophanase [Candidatus Lokiarchaeota archaeon]|nr:tryptophanase [Candidatus Lokiarchaeota archaeon]MBD3202573.1 tryptophanase [Candidatus Lokiarchaeota archaeon]